MDVLAKSLVDAFAAGDFASCRQIKLQIEQLLINAEEAQAQNLGPPEFQLSIKNEEEDLDLGADFVAQFEKIPIPEWVYTLPDPNPQEIAEMMKELFGEDANAPNKNHPALVVNANDNNPAPVVNAANNNNNNNPARQSTRTITLSQEKLLYLQQRSSDEESDDEV